MLRIEKSYSAKNYWLNFLEETGLLRLWNACYTRLIRRGLPTAKPAVVDVVLRALTEMRAS